MRKLFCSEFLNSATAELVYMPMSPGLAILLPVFFSYVVSNMCFGEARNPNGFSYGVETEDLELCTVGGYEKAERCTRSQVFKSLTFG